MWYWRGQIPSETYADLCNLFDRKNILRSAHTYYRKIVSVRVDLSLLRVAVGFTHIWK